MDDDLLHEVIAVETEIQRNIAIEKKKAHELIEKVRREAEDEIVREEERVKESGAQALREAKAEAERKPRRLLRKLLQGPKFLKSLTVNPWRRSS